MNFKVVPFGDGTFIYWLEFLKTDGTLIWVPRYRVGPSPMRKI